MATVLPLALTDRLPLVLPSYRFSDRGATSSLPPASASRALIFSSLRLDT